MSDLDFEQLSRELVRALRGERSQVAFSRRLRYRSNVAYLWESGRNWPTAATLFWAAERTGVDVRGVVGRFYRRPPEWLASADLTSREGVATLLADLRGSTPIGDLAERTGRDRFAVSRWLRGRAEPRLPDFLRLVEAASLRVLDLLAQLVDVTGMPSAVEPWTRLEAARRLVSQTPWSTAVLLALETESYRALPAHRPGWIARWIGIPEEVEAECLRSLADSGQIRRRGGLWRVVRVQTIDTRSDPAAGQRLKSWWARVGLDRLEAGADGLFSYNVFNVSAADYERLRDMHRRYYRALRATVARSAPAERLVVVNLQLFPLHPDAPPPTRRDRPG